MGDFNQEDRLKIRQLENELKEVKKELNQRAVGNDQMVKRVAQLEMNDRARRFFNTLPPPNSERKIVLQNGHKFTPDIGAFMRHGAPYCHGLSIQRRPNGSAFSGQPSNFFDNLIKHIHETESPDEMVANLDIALAVDNAALWPTLLVQVLAANLGLINKEQWEKDGVPTLTVEKVDYGNKVVEYTMSNKHKSEARFKLYIYFEGEAKCYQQMTRFAACRTDMVTFSVPGSQFEHGEEEEKRRKLETELQELKAKKGNLEMEMGEVKDQLSTKNSELQKKNGNLEKELRDVDVKDQLNEVNRKIDKIVIGYARTLPAASSDGNIELKNGHKYTPEIDIFLCYGAALCVGFVIWGNHSIGFVGYPANFFDDLIKHYYETKAPRKAVRYVNIRLPSENPTPWPVALVQSQAEEMKVHNDRKYVEYIVRNNHNPGIAFTLYIFFEGNAKCYQQMTSFIMKMTHGKSV